MSYFFKTKAAPATIEISGKRYKKAGTGPFE